VKLKQLRPGIYIDEETDTLHVYAAEVCRALGAEDTEANQEMVRQMVKEVYPESPFETLYDPPQ
jgi:hypothetical protein